MADNVLIPVHVRIMLRELQADTARAENLLNGLERDVNIGFDLNTAELDSAARLVNDLDTTINTRVNVNDSELDTAKDIHTDLQTNTTFTAEVTVEPELTDTINDIRALERIQVAFDVAPMVFDAAAGAGNFLFDISGIDTLIEMDTLLSGIQGRTGEMIPGAERLIQDLYINGFADSRAEIAEVITLASQLGINNENLAGAIETAFNVATVTGGDANETLRTMDQLVSLGLVPNYQTAGDLIVTGFRDGANRADDLNETLIEYGSTFADLGIDGERALSIINNGLENGFMNSDLAADAVREFGRIMREEIDNPAVTDALERLDLTEMREQFLLGEVSGETLFDAVLDGLEEIPTEAERSQLAITLFGDMVGDVGSDAVLSLNDTEGAIENVEGAARDAANEVRDNLGTRLVQFGRKINSAVEEGVQEVIDVEALLTRFETGIETFFDELAAGEDIFSAAEIAFEIPGLANTMQDIQQVFANIGLGLLEVVSAISSILSIDNTGLNNMIADLGSVQFGADLFAADTAEDIASSVNRAIERGVDPETIFADLAAGFESAIAEGDFASALNIQQFLADLQSLGQAGIPVGDPTIDGGSWGDMFREMEADIAARMSDVDLSENTAAALVGDNFGSAMEGLLASALDPEALQSVILASTSTLEEGLADTGAGIADIEESAGNLSAIFTDITTDTGGWLPGADTFTDFNTNLDTTEENAGFLGVAIDDLAADTNGAMAIAGKGVGTFASVAGGFFTDVSSASGKLVKGLQQDADTISGIAGGIAATIAGLNASVTVSVSAGAGNTTVNNNTNVNVNATTPAAANATTSAAVAQSLNSGIP